MEINEHELRVNRDKWVGGWRNSEREREINDEARARAREKNV